jgi:hypothetical protein
VKEEGLHQIGRALLKVAGEAPDAASGVPRPGGVEIDHRHASGGQTRRQLIVRGAGGRS